jgi:hypothetical protein
MQAASKTTTMMSIFKVLSDELMDRILTFIRCSTTKLTFLNSCNLAQQLYYTSKELRRAFRTLRKPDGSLQAYHGCFVAPCGPHMGHASQHYRAQCCLHPKRLEELRGHNPPYIGLGMPERFKGSIYYECCSPRCPRVIDHDVRTTHTTSFWKQTDSWNVNQICLECGESVAPPVVDVRAHILGFTHADNPAIPTAQKMVYGLGSIVAEMDKDSMIVCNPHHIGVEAHEIPDYTLQTFYDESYEGDSDPP